MTCADKPICSVCIANYNGIDVIGPCLDSVLLQDFELPIEIIVHDDASMDGSVDFIREKYPEVRQIVSSTNVGYCVSNNRMVEQAQGEFILLLNNDTMLHEDALSTLYDFAVQQEVRGIVGLPQYNMVTGELIDIGSMLDPFFNPVPNRNPARQNVAMIIGACLWLPRALWVTLGGFPEWFESLAEDMFLCCIARLQGYPVTALPISGFDHFVGKSFGGGKTIRNAMNTTYRRRALSERNKTFVMIMCCPSPLSRLLIPVHLILFTLEGLLISLFKRDKRLWKTVYLNSLSAVVQKSKILSDNRKKIQACADKAHRFFLSFTLSPYKLVMLYKHGLPEVS
ncbi:MAG: glycosyltransferase family 2 protein [Anaerolineaceae bacterium]